MPGIDPKDPNIVYMVSTVTWKSTDGGKTWTGFRGASDVPPGVTNPVTMIRLDYLGTPPDGSTRYDEYYMGCAAAIYLGKPSTPSAL